MLLRSSFAILVLAIAPRVAAAQQYPSPTPAKPAPTSPPASPTMSPSPAMAMSPGAASPDAAPVANAFRYFAGQASRNLTAAADEMPAARYRFKPTPAQMSFGDIVVHLAEGNDFLCGTIAGTKAPERAKVAATAGKPALVARLRETFQFCDQSLAGVDDSKLSDSLSMFGQTMTRAGVMMVTVADWADHYSQSAIYLRLNGLLPPTAKKRAAEAAPKAMPEKPAPKGL